MTILIPHSNQQTFIIIQQNDIGKNNVLFVNWEHLLIRYVYINFYTILYILTARETLDLSRLPENLYAQY